MDGDSLVNKIVVTFLVFSCLFSCFSMVARSDIKIWPASLTITMQGGFSDEEITHPIQVTNPHSRGLNVSARIESPAISQLKEGYSYMPNLS